MKIYPNNSKMPTGFQRHRLWEFTVSDQNLQKVPLWTIVLHVAGQALNIIHNPTHPPNPP